MTPLLLTCISLLATVFPDANELLARVAKAQPANEERSKQYTCQEQCDRFHYDGKGLAKRYLTETSEVIFVEGIEFKKLTTRNGKPIGSKEKARVEAEMRKTAEERRRTGRKATPGGRIGLGGHNVDLGDANDLLALFENKVLREDTFEGRKVWVVDCQPKPVTEIGSRHQTDALTFARTLWITEEDAIPVRIIYTAVVDHDFIRAGSTLTLEYTPVSPDTWHPSKFILDMNHFTGKAYTRWQKTEYIYSNFKKFDVQSTITVDPAN